MKDSLKSVILILALLLGMSPVSMAERSVSKPQWVSKGETTLNNQRSNKTYYFKVIQSTGRDLQTLINNRIVNLANYIGQSNNLSGTATTEIVNEQQGGTVQSSSSFRVTFKNDVSTPTFYAQLVDEYWELDAAGYTYYALFAVSEKGQATFDRFEVTRSYGALPAVMSVIPGVGQLYKGQKLKGSLMLGGAVLCAGGIILCENRRAYYQTRIIEQPKFARDWSKKSNNWETGRNIAIGATAALVAWSVIDAAVAPGTTRIKISPSTSFALRPAALTTPDGVGMGASLALSF